MLWQIDLLNTRPVIPLDIDGFGTGYLQSIRFPIGQGRHLPNLEM